MSRTRTATRRTSTTELQRVPGTCAVSLRSLWLQRQERRRVFRALEAHVLPRLALLEQPAQKHVVERMARLVAAERTDQWMPQQIQVADRVQHLVLHELVLIAQPVGI